MEYMDHIRSLSNLNLSKGKNIFMTVTKLAINSKRELKLQLYPIKGTVHKLHQHFWVGSGYQNAAGC